MIEFNHVEIKYGDFVAINDLNLQINQGEFFTFLGPSGSGKTTTLRALVGFENPTKGTIVVNGEDITNKPIEKRGIAMVFQSYALFPNMSVEENITFGLKERKVDKQEIQTRVKQVAKMVNLTTDQLHRGVSELSGGQQQRVAIARALALQPNIIALDEPLSNLDAHLRKNLRRELKQIQNESNITMIYVTHDQEEALTLSDRIAVFNNGFLEQVGTPQEIYDHPISPYVTRFIGDSNELTEETIQILNQNNPGLKLDPSKKVFVRIENVTDDTRATNDDRYLRLPATFKLQEFYGMTTRRVSEVGNMHLTSIQQREGLDVDINQPINLKISPDDLIIFDRG
ncbi:ABC transporter ATP-binding protein [Fundicoccus culcitae]|uniref:ABC transporter ATP-binding protein n=1 Tax=Fundicoccus culcitae TaxID=2969821 RepID=A0ABY5P409_9LACT|nr:ABC transporter ATP-binding protein [Fundicoccus culcitae]UUX33467.1 ABC transporter ATP-binding protein [Fundicoccus culcitae]